MHDSLSNCTIAIIGAGFSGTMMAIQLRHRLPAAARILLIERSGIFARGVAYAQTSQPYLLNVRAANMSAFPHDPGHFERWLSHAPEIAHADIVPTEAGIFAARRLYGRYLQETLAATRQRGHGEVELVEDEIERLTPSRHGWVLRGASGARIQVSGVVLACGNLPSVRPHDGLVFSNPWREDALRGLNPSDAVVIVGTGLTMVDLVFGLQSTGFEGPIIAISRRGLLPHPHAATPGAWPTPDFPLKTRQSATALLRAVRAELRLAARQGVCWRAVIDSLRPITSKLWHGLPVREQARFLRHARPYWDVHRHRLPPSSTAALADLRAVGRLRLLRGRIGNISCEAPGLAAVRITRAAGGEAQTIMAQRVIYATGVESIRSGNGLLGTLLQEELASVDELALGLRVDSGLRVLDKTGQPVPALWALGPLVRGKFWECTAVPDIRLHAQQLSTLITAELAAADSYAAFL